MRYFLFVFAFLLFYSFSAARQQDRKTPGNSLDRTHTYPKLLKDTCIIAGYTFRMVDFKSGRTLKAFIKNGEISILSEGVQYFNYRVIYYVFSSLDDDRVPVVRNFDGRVSYRVIKVLENSRVGGQYIFEDIIVVDPSGIKLDNEVRSILIERVK